MIRPAILFAALALGAPSFAQENAPDGADKLEDVRARIRDVQSGIKAARDEAEARLT